jgi:hypothetical protein
MDDAPRSAAASTPGPHPPYEQRDANTKGVLSFLVVLFVVINLVLLGTWRLFRHFAVADQPPAPPSSFSNTRQLPPEPLLQVEGRQDFQKMYASQQEKLAAYAWEDRSAGTVRIPIDRAMDLLLQKGLPVLPQAPANQAAAKSATLPHSQPESARPAAAVAPSPRGDGQ